MLAAILRAGDICTQVMDQNGAAVPVSFVWTARVPAMTVEDKHIARLTFDHDLVWMRGI
jgi:hypothetical protein